MLVFGFAIMANAQQEHQFTQWMYNKLAYNPAYAGSSFSPCISGLYRNQWIGLEGSPETQLLSFDMPLENDRVGIGANLYRNAVGITEVITLDGAYAYRIPLGRGFLGLGVQASIRYFSQDFSDSRVVSTLPIGPDGAIPQGELNKYVPDFGAGFYYNTQNFYIGGSVNRIINNNIDLNDNDLEIGREVQHVYLMAGYKVRLNENLDLLPQFLLKFAENSPLDLDLNANLLIQDKFTAGLSYRLGGSNNDSIGESIDLLFGAQFTDNVFAGISWDFTLSELNDFNNGTLEIALRYCLQQSEGEEFQNPRFF